MQMVAYSHTRFNAETFMCSMGAQKPEYTPDAQSQTRRTTE
jgi:hypothetical protein